jgi:hypothetical protein
MGADRGGSGDRAVEYRQMGWCVAVAGTMRNAVRVLGRMAFRVTLILAVGYAEVGRDRS